MTDNEIIILYFNRSEDAITETDHKYGRLCHKISMGILNDRRDSEECVSDTFMVCWNRIPPTKPNPLKAFICRIIKNLSLKKYEYNHAEKRNSEYETSLDELAGCLTGSQTAEDPDAAYELKELKAAINRFLGSLPQKKRVLFLRRYWFLQPVKEIARDYGITEKSASMRLSRLRGELYDYLKKEGFI